MEKKTKIILITSVAIVIIAAVLCILKANEDNWIKDSRGIYIMHGNPASLPVEVEEQQRAISCASNLYAEANLRNMNFSSQCLGKCGDYSIDIVHTPRTEEDDKEANQCLEYNERVTTHFIELNKNGEIIRIA